METATQRVASALAANRLPTRKDVETSLRESWGLSARQAKRFAAEGIRALGTRVEDDMLERLKQWELAIKNRTQ